MLLLPRELGVGKDRLHKLRPLVSVTASGNRGRTDSCSGKQWAVCAVKGVVSCVCKKRLKIL